MFIVSKGKEKKIYNIESVRKSNRPIVMHNDDMV